MNESVEKKKLFPNVYVILVTIAILAAVLTWIIPAGTYKRVTESGISKVIPGSFHLVERAPQGLWSVLLSIVEGFKKQISLIMMVFFVGSAVGILSATKALDVGFAKLARSVRGKESFAILVIMAIMSLGGATGVFGNVTLVLIPVGIVLSMAMGFDPALGFAMIFFGSFSGFNVGWANFATIGIAQTIAQLPIFSGIGVRIILHIINFILSYGFVMLYFRKIKADPSNSLNYESGMDLSDYMGAGSPTQPSDSTTNLSVPQTVSLILAAAGIVAVVVGALNFKWGADQISATFLAVTILIGLVSGFGLEKTTREFLKGCQGVVDAAFIIGFANAITIILTKGSILDTVVYYVSNPINQFGPIAGANFMLLVNIIINFFISSGSGQATAVMPIMVPVADLTGITRQVAVQAFQFGDGFTNCIIPTVGSLMGGLAFAKIPYGRYLKWVMPLILIQIGLAFVAISILQGIGWNG